MHIAVDASNLGGGCAIHLQEVLNAADLEAHGIDKITIWGRKATLERIQDSKIITCRTHRLIELGGIPAAWFRYRVLDRKIPPEVDLLWVPGGIYTGAFRPYVAMAQNLLPFVKEERDRYRYSRQWLRYVLLPRLQTFTFRHAQGLIHVSAEAKGIIGQAVDLTVVRQVVIPHGVNPRFFRKPVGQADWQGRRRSDPVRVLSVSRIERYKHQDQLLLAAARLRQRGISLTLEFIGPAEKGAWRTFSAIRRQCDPEGEWINYHGEVSPERLADHYFNADLFVDLSSCESFGLSLLEAMAAGLPIVCSKQCAHPGLREGACVTVDPEDVEGVASGIERMVCDRELRKRCAMTGYRRAKEFSWKRCADETFSFLTKVANDWEDDGVRL